MARKNRIARRHRKPLLRSQRAGLPPGTLTASPGPEPGDTRIEVFSYTASSHEQKRVGTAAECAAMLAENAIVWINVVGVQQTDVLQDFGKLFNIDPLNLEDIASLDQRTKVEDRGHYGFIALKELTVGADGHSVESEQISIVLGERYVLSFQERPGDAFGHIRERIVSGRGRVRQMGADYLAYALIDAVVDYYFLVLDALSKRSEEIENQLISTPEADVLPTLHSTRYSLLEVRRAAWPLREVLALLLKGEDPIISEPVRPFIQDVYDHTIQAIDMVEMGREHMNGLMDLHLSLQSTRMTEVMKVLTIITTIFIPLTFVAGVYGMNFRYMPELESRWGYPVALGLMAAMAGILIFYFRRKRWF